MNPNPDKIILHYIKIGHYETFKRYDTTQEDYDLKQIKLPVYLFYGANDKFANEKVSVIINGY